MERRIRTLIADHEPVAREQIRSMSCEEPDVEVIGEARDGHEAVEAILNQAPDLVFLDVQIPKLDAFDIISAVGADRMPPVVCVGACGQHALRAFDIQALDYLLKPLDRTRFQEAVSRARLQIVNQERHVLGRTLLTLVRNMPTADLPPAVPAGNTSGRVVVQSGDRLLFVRTDDVDSVEGAGNHVRLHVDGESHLVRETMSAFEARLPADVFARIHRSHIVNLERVKELRPSFNGEYAVILRNGTALPLSRRYRETLQHRFGRRL